MANLGVGGGHLKAVHDFIAVAISDEALQERVLHVFSALPEDVQQEFMRDRGFSIGIYDVGQAEGTTLLIPCPAAARGSRLVTLEVSLRVRARAFAHYVIAHEFAHALLWNRGRHAWEDPEVAADAVAAEWGFRRPFTLPLL